ncbi:MAG: 23S rRNA (adenine(2503)-C(2))-methyltransferase RlmN [Leptospira sp.]|nr:23S rRNA (adenine(2503)-C(2))-methyltransferase RlmN [Leptospira sp.]
MKEEKFQPKGKTIQELSEFLKTLGEPAFRGMQIFQGLYKHKYRTWEEFTNLPKPLRAKLSEYIELADLPVGFHMVSEDGTQKFTFKLEGGKEVEAVWIPRGDGARKTICISSQVGCTLNCSFCATAKLPFQGNLKTWQILDQVLSVERIVGDHATNIVFMGMGEPLHNYFEVMRAATILHHPEAWNLGAKRITISTAGVVPGIHRYIDNKEPFNFAISLNQPDPNTRSEIMDVNEKFGLDKLIEAAERFVRELGRTITFEYVMIPGVNMSDKHIQLLGKIARKVGNCKFNVIPLNTEFFGWTRPSDTMIEDFVTKLKSASRVPVMNRRSPGKEIGGACGMLALSGTNNS